MHTKILPKTPLQTVVAGGGGVLTRYVPQNMLGSVGIVHTTHKHQNDLVVYMHAQELKLINFSK